MIPSGSSKESLIGESQLTPNPPIESNIISIKTCKLKPLTYLVVALTDTGLMNMHLFVVNKFYQIQPLSDAVDAKVYYRKCEISKNGDLMALFVECK
jgi:hypothetical protein